MRLIFQMNIWSSRTKKLLLFFNDYVNILHEIEQLCQQDEKGGRREIERNHTFELPNYHFLQEMKKVHSHLVKQSTPTVDVYSKKCVIA